MIRIVCELECDGCGLTETTALEAIAHHYPAYKAERARYPLAEFQQLNVLLPENWGRTERAVHGLPLRMTLCMKCKAKEAAR